MDKHRQELANEVKQVLSCSLGIFLLEEKNPGTCMINSYNQFTNAENQDCLIANLLSSSTALAMIKMIMITLFSIESHEVQCRCASVWGDGIGGLELVERRPKGSITSKLPSVKFPRHSSSDQKILGLSFLSLIAVKHSERSTNNNESTCNLVKKNCIFHCRLPLHI